MTFPSSGTYPGEDDLGFTAEVAEIKARLNDNGTGSDDVATFVNAGSSADTDLLASCFAVAVEATAAELGNVTAVTQVPTATLARVVVEVAADLWHRRNAPGGIAAWAGETASPVYVRRDALHAVRPLLAPYVGGPFA